MRALARVAEDADVVLLHENEKDIYGDVPSRCLDVVRSVDSPHLRLAWDPANFVQVGVRPYTEGYQILRPHVEYVQIKDALAADGTVVTAGKGDGEVAADHPRPAARRVRRVLLARAPPGRHELVGRLLRPRALAPGPFRLHRASSSRGDRVRMSTKRKVALVGAGVIGTHHGLVLSQLADRLELAAVVDVAIDRAEKLAAERGGRPFASLSEALAAADVDIVVVCVPTGRHGEVAIEALDAGKHVIVEKPAETTVPGSTRSSRPSRRPARSSRSSPSTASTPPPRPCSPPSRAANSAG